MAEFDRPEIVGGGLPPSRERDGKGGAAGGDRGSGGIRLTRTTALLATIGAAALGYMAVTAYQRAGSRRARGSALADSERHAAEDFSTTRSAGPQAMRDPPSSWSRADEASDESFPASDPPPVGSRID